MGVLCTNGGGVDGQTGVSTNTPERQTPLSVRLEAAVGTNPGNGASMPSRMRDVVVIIIIITMVEMACNLWQCFPTRTIF